MRQTRATRRKGPLPAARLPSWAKVKQVFHTTLAIAVAAIPSGCGPPGSGQTLMQAGISEDFLRLDDNLSVRIFARLPAEPPRTLVIFIHGTPGSADTWTDTLAQTPADYAAIAYDRLGYGETNPDKPVTSLETHANTVSALSAELKARVGDAAVPIILVGHSYGGPIAAKAAALDPERYRAVVHIASALDPGLEKVHWAQRLATYQPIKFLIGSTLRNANAELIALEQELIDLEAQLGDMAVPTYVLHGSEDELVPIANVDFMKQTYPPDMLCSIEIIPGQNHFLPWNEIDALWALIAAATEGRSAAC